MHYLLVDTCVWLDIAADYREQPVIEALEDLVQGFEIELVVPQQVLDEFARSKTRVIENATKSLQAQMRLVKEAVNRFGEDKQKEATLDALSDVDRKMFIKGEAMSSSFERIEKLLKAVAPAQTTDAIKLRVADRAIARQAPFHTGRSSMGDAILLEHYADLLETLKDRDNRASFVTHNFKDFGPPNGDKRQFHTDLAPLFSDHHSNYFTALVQAIKYTDPVALADRDWEFSFSMEPRRHSEIVAAEELLFRQIWYNRHWNRRVDIDEGRIKVVPDAKYDPKKHGEQIMESVWKGALAAAKKTEDEVGLGDLGPWDDFEWGMLYGKLSALRWVLGDEWDFLDT